MKKLKKILYINNFFSDFGGAEKTMYNEALLLRKENIETFFFATDKQPYFEKDYLYSDFFPKFVNYRKLSKIDALFGFFRPFYNFEAEKKLDELLKIIKPDIARCCNIYYHLTPSILKVCKRNNIPVAMSIHDCRLFCPSGNLMIKNKELCSEHLCMSKTPLHCVKNLCKNDKLIPSLIVTMEHIFNKSLKLYENVDHFICQSDAMRQLAAKSGIPFEKLFLLNTFLADSYFDKPSVYENNSYFLFIGRISEEKGIKILIDALKQVPEIPVHIVGTGPHEDYYKDLVKKYGLNKVKFMGYKSGAELEEEYKNCIATILPCNWFENFPRSILESFAYGKPAIASRVGGIPEIIDDGMNGFTFEVGNYKLLANYMKILFNDPQLSVKMGTNAREKAEKNYDSKIYLEKVLKIYNSIINEKPTYSLDDDNLELASF